MEKITLDPAVLADAAEMLAIYAPYVKYTTVSSEYEPPTLAEFEDRMRTYGRTLPWLICRVNGAAAGYGYASPHRTRAGYQWSAETSIYVHPDYHRRGVAAAIYHALFDLLREQGIEPYVLSTESCAECARCAWLDGQPCRFPERMHPCVESHGINILPLIEELGLCFQYGENVVTWFSLLLY